MPTAVKTMNIRQGHRYVEIDVQTRRDGNSAALVAQDDLTEVSFGGLHASVMLHDLGVVVTMNPDKGEWKNLEWARRRALDTILAPEIVLEVLLALCVFHRKFGEQEGRRGLQREFWKLLGSGNSG